MLIKFLPFGLLFISGVGIADNSAVYDAQSQLLTLPVVNALGSHWSVELLDKGGYQFQLQSASVFTGAIGTEIARFDSVTGVLSIPMLSALGKNWALTLTKTAEAGFNFKLSSSRIIPESTPEPDVINPGPVTPDINPKDRYLLSANGIAKDQQTGLEWMRCSLGQSWNGQGCIGELARVSMDEAAYQAFKSNFNGQSDWRLPSIDELKTLIYCSSGAPETWNTSGRGCAGDYKRPTIYLEAFPDAGSAVYWSATQLQADPGPDYSLTVSFNYGHVYYGYFAGVYHAARFVRGKSNIVPGPESVGGFKE